MKSKRKRNRKEIKPGRKLKVILGKVNKEIKTTRKHLRKEE